MSEEKIPVVAEKPLKVPVVDEADKPFYLAIISILLFAIVIIMGGIGAFFEKAQMIEYAKYAGTAIVGLVSTAWAWYFKSKSS